MSLRLLALLALLVEENERALHAAHAAINAAALPVLALDLPSGLSADTGSAADVAVKADITVTFVAAKQGMFTGRGPALCGEIIYHSLDINEEIFEHLSPDAKLMDLDDLMDEDQYKALLD